MKPKAYVKMKSQGLLFFTGNFNILKEVRSGRSVRDSVFGRQLKLGNTEFLLMSSFYLVSNPAQSSFRA